MTFYGRSGMNYNDRFLYDEVGSNNRYRWIGDK
jgi:hypothetical protein